MAGALRRGLWKGCRQAGSGLDSTTEGAEGKVFLRPNAAFQDSGFRIQDSGKKVSVLP
jgi:hypothetical protein